LEARQRRVMIRIFIFLLVFVYIAYWSYALLPPFDFGVIILFFAVFLSWTLLSETMIYQAPDVYVIEDEDRHTFLWLQLSFFIALLYSAIDFAGSHYTRMYFLEPWVVAGGFILFLISCPIRWQGFKHIGKLFNHRVALYQDHRLVKSGIYSRIRHPIYLGNLLSFLAIPLIFSSWGGLLIIVLTTIPALIYRIKIEEEFLLRHFGKEYEEYMKETNRFLPGLI
jgi:protein-S-isoprenylcysteine O-methyltransferase Ste14